MPEPSRGLSAADVLASRAAHGVNVLTPPQRTPLWKLYLAKFDDPVIRILMIAAGIAIAVGAVDGHVAEGVGILVAILLATFLAFWNELRAARQFDILNTTSDDVPVKVLRDGGYTLVPRRDVVVGDLVFIEVGEEVPADGELLEAVGLQVDESKLTGEALPVERGVSNRLFRGTTIADGSGRLALDAVGDRTELGRTLRESLIESDDDSPLQKQLLKLSKIIGVVGFGISALVFVALLVLGLSRGTVALNAIEGFFLTALTASLAVALVNVWLPIVYDGLQMLGVQREAPAWLGGRSWLVSLVAGAVVFSALVGVGMVTHFLPVAPSEWLSLTDAKQLLRNFMIAVTIIVVAVPEGLAMSVTLSLAYSMRKMAAGHTLVRRMDACETIGAATVICSDKTGTLTMNEMRVVETLAEPGTLFTAIAANSTAHLSREGESAPKALGNPTEGALLVWLWEQGQDYLALRESFSVRRQWNFNTERKFMATLGDRLHVKGAPEIVLARCSTSGGRPMTATDIETITAKLQEYQLRGMRTLAFAMGEAGDGDDIEAQAQDLTWLGLVAIADPVRPEVPGAVAACRAAGVRVKIVTGDNALTAAEIARQIGLDADPVTLTGPEFAALGDAEASEAAERLSILARARPADKLRLVRLLQARGEVVAVTGDGVNDGPALNFADVGLAMGRSGTAVAREASDIILLDDSFPSIVAAIRWGRSLYENIQRFILFQLTINVVALGLAVLGPFLGYELPLTVMQMLWVNLIMDTFAALALATEPPHDGVLQRPPRSPQAFIITRMMARGIFGVGLLLLVLLVAGIIYCQQHGLLPADDSPSRVGTLLFTTFVMMQFWNLFNAKAMGRSGSVLPTLSANPSFLAIAAAILAGQVLIVQFGGDVFRTVPLSLTDWLSVLGLTSLVLWIGEAARMLRRS